MYIWYRRSIKFPNQASDNQHKFSKVRQYSLSTNIIAEDLDKFIILNDSGNKSQITPDVNPGNVSESVLNEQNSQAENHHAE